MTLHILLVEADDSNDVEELLHSGNYYDINTPIADMIGFVNASVKVSVQTGTEFNRYEVELLPSESGIVEGRTEHIKV